MNVVVIVLAIVSGLSIQLAANGRLPRNGILGIRTMSVRRDDSTWRRGHRAAVVPTWMTVVITAAIESLSLIMDSADLSVVLSWVGLAVLFLGTLVAAIVASRAARTHGDRSRRQRRSSRG
jgi:uncharacterized membrane protein